MAEKTAIFNLFFFNPQGDYRFSWRHPQGPGKEIYTLKYYADLAHKAEAAILDNIFIADHVAIWDTVPSGLAHYANPRLEPITLLGALAAVTENIGLMATASTSYNEPYNLARYFASLDFLSNGRASWNVVTSWLPEEAANYGLEQLPEHGYRYQRAEEFIEVVRKLWDSWEDEAVIIDKQSGYFARPELVHQLNHQGRFFKVRGPLNLPRPPQGHPIVVQAGSSESGKNLAAAQADIHFVFMRNIEKGLAYRADMNKRLQAVGRDPEHFKILGGVLPIVVNSAAEKADRQQQIDEMMNDQMALDLLSTYLRMDLSQYDPHQPLALMPEEEGFDGLRTHLQIIRGYDANLSILQLGRLLLQSSDSWLVMGTAQEVAATLTEAFHAGAVDGYNLMFPFLPLDFDNFIDQVAPILKANGVMKQAYQPGTLREKLGLPPVANQFSQQ